MTNSLISILEYVIRGIEHTFRDRDKKKDREQRGEEKKRRSSGTGRSDRKISPSTNNGGGSGKNGGIQSIYSRLSSQLNHYPKSMDEYIEAIYSIKKGLDVDVDINTLRALALSSITIDQVKNRVLDRNNIDEHIRYLDNIIPTSVKPLIEERLSEYAKKINKELGKGNLNKKDFLNTYDKIAEIVERSLLQYENYDIEKILEKIALNSKDSMEYLEKAQLLESILARYRDEIEKRRRVEKNEQIIDEKRMFVYRDIYRPIVSLQKKLLLYYNSLAKKYVHLLSIPKTRSVLPIELSETDKWKPWRDDVSTLNIVDSAIRGAGRFIWGITTRKNVPINFKSYYIDKTITYSIGVSIDISASTGKLSGNMTNVIEYEFVLALAVYHFAIRHNAPLILHLWSSDEAVFKIRSRITGFIDKLYHEIQRIAEGGTEPYHLLRLMKEHENIYWIILTDLEWPEEQSEKMLSFLKSKEQKGELNYLFINIYNPKDIYCMSPIIYCKKTIHRYDSTCKLYDYLLKHKRIITYDVIHNYDRMIKDILKKMKNIVYNKNTNQ